MRSEPPPLGSFHFAQTAASVTLLLVALPYHTPCEPVHSWNCVWNLYIMCTNAAGKTYPTCQHQGTSTRCTASTHIYTTSLTICLGLGHGLLASGQSGVCGTGVAQAGFPSNRHSGPWRWRVITFNCHYERSQPAAQSPLEPEAPSARQTARHLPSWGPYGTYRWYAAWRTLPGISLDPYQAVSAVLGCAMAYTSSAQT